MHKNNNQNWSKRAEKGLVSIFVVTVFMALLTLIVIGFAKIMNRELRQSLDRELATQANFAVESGMNDARAAVSAAINNGTLDSLDTGGKCMDLSTLKKPFILNGSLSGLYNNDDNDKLIRYTCVIIQTQPKQLTEIIPRGQSKTYLISTTTPLNSIYVGWQNRVDTNNPQPLAAAYQLPQESSVSSDKTGLLRATLYPITNAMGASQPSDVQNAALSSASRTYFMYPNGAAVPTTAANIPSVFYGPSNGIFVNGNCNAANRKNSSYLPFAQASGRYCNSKISNLAPAPPPPPAAVPKVYNVTLAADNTVNSFYINGTRVNFSGSPEWWFTKTGTVTLTSPPQEFALKATNTLVGGATWSGNPAMAIFTITDPSTGAVVARSSSGLVFSSRAQSGGADPVGWPRPNILGWGATSYQNFGGPVTWGYNWGPSISGWPDPLAQFMWPTAGTANVNLNVAYFYAGTPPAPPPPPPPITPVGSFYYLRLTALYQDLNVYVVASDATNNPLNLSGAQVVIDVTAQGNDVLKRERANLSVGKQSDLLFPNYALQSMDTLCKRLRLPKLAAGSVASSFGNAIYDDPNETGSADVAAACSANGVLPSG
jgi:hypothetical protein